MSHRAFSLRLKGGNSLVHDLPLEVVTGADMEEIRISTKRFVPDKDYVSYLFAPGGTPDGTYKVLSSGILFCHPSGKPIAKLVANRHNEQFFVSCSKCADGKLWYMFALSDADKTRLGMEGLGYGDSHALARTLWCKHGPSALHKQPSSTKGPNETLPIQLHTETIGLS